MSDDQQLFAALDLGEYSDYPLATKYYRLLSSFVDCFNKIMNYFDIRIKLNPSLWNSSVQRMPKGKGSGWRMRKRQKKNRNIILLVFMSDFATRQLYTAQNIHVHVLSIIYHSLPTIAANKIYMYYQQQSTIMSVFNVM